jgi:hypothetical protein
MEVVLQVWKHHDIDLWSPLQDLMVTPIPKNMYILKVIICILQVTGKV